MMRELICSEMLERAKDLLPKGLTKNGIASGLDETIFAFFISAPKNLLNDKIITEIFLRIWKFHNEFTKRGVELNIKNFDSLFERTFKSNSERSSFGLTQIRELNHFNKDNNRVGLIDINKDRIQLILTKTLSRITYGAILNKYGKSIHTAGNALQWELPPEQHNLLEYLVPAIEEDFAIIGKDKYYENLESITDDIESSPILSIITANQAPNKLIVDLQDEHFHIMCGTELRKFNKIFLKIAERLDDGTFKIQIQHVKAINLLIKCCADKTFLTSTAKNSIPTFTDMFAENDSVTIGRGAAIYDIQAVLEKSLFSLKLNITHFPHKDAVAKKIMNTFKKVKQEKSRTLITITTKEELFDANKLCAELEIPTFHFVSDNPSSDECLQGSDVFLHALDYLYAVKDKPKGTLSYLGGRHFKIRALSTGQEADFSLKSKEDTEAFREIVNKYKPICDSYTLDKFKNIDNLGAFECETPNGVFYKITPLANSETPAFTFLPPHCTRKEGKSAIVLIHTASHGAMLRNIIGSSGFLEPKNREKILTLLNKRIDTLQDRYNLSYTTTSDMVPKNFAGADRIEPAQMGCVEYITPIKKGLIADKPGFGKTWEAAAIIAHNDAFPCLVITPKMAKKPWLNEVTALIKNKKAIMLGESKDRDYEKSQMKHNDVLVINYDMLVDFKDELQAIKLKSVIIDESHYIKHAEAQRTKAVLEICKATDPDFILAMSGTHWENNPSELWTTIQLLGKQTFFGGEDAYKKRYCTSSDKNSLIQAQNLEELNEVTRSHFLIRRDNNGTTERVWRQAYIPLEDLDLSEYRDQEEQFARGIMVNILKDVDKLIENKPHLAEHKLRLIEEKTEAKFNSIIDSKTGGKGSAGYANCRKLLGQAKIKPSYEYGKNIIDQGEKVVIFAHHIAVQEGLIAIFKEGGYKTTSVTGDMSSSEREESVKSFQEGDKQVIICSLSAASENLNLSASSYVIITEPTGLPQVQARMRIDRHPQKSNILNCVYLRIFGTLDDNMYKRAEEKTKLFIQSTGEVPEAPIANSEAQSFAKSLALKYTQQKN